MCTMCDNEDHIHVWGPIQRSRIAGTLHRECEVIGCKFISLDLDESEDYGDA